ncbi:hypothetical protein BASA61_006467 [Batrachochytrium salamandrivorans]|nr:hypothetical protein BASA61_006467 [Batrachochytrium salamandrivorans]KAH9275217.1 hypothetical protein BASA83_002445 [Batrachochytrium salamandrivorans]KAJ1343014.1 hypothetical protein BSLG_002439 [Batrachochytrium salamandrivorans]
MTVSPLTILDRLISENLHGPTAPFTLPRSTSSKGNVPNVDQWVVIGSEHADLDCKDPRWFELFMDFFIKTTGFEVHDDLLFFVRQLSSSSKSSTASLPDTDIVLVKRRVPGVVPALDDIVDWKQSFFLNLISQLPCTLTVTVCTRGPATSVPPTPPTVTPQMSARPSEVETLPTLGNGIQEGVPVSQRPPIDLSENSAFTNHTQTHNGTPDVQSDISGYQNGPSTNPDSYPSDTLINHSTNTNGQSESPELAIPPTSSIGRRVGGTTRMIAKRRITKKVFAAPYKCRMDVQDALMNECSFPLVYYTVNDFESHALHLPISEREYMCVELSLTVPDDQSSEAYALATDAVARISIEDDNSPFPLPPKHSKIVLFQGAVPYASLLDIYQQKGLAARSQLKSSWSSLGRLSPSNSSGASNSNHSPTDLDPSKAASRTEYIMMRGPHGKGQCQVAITDNDNYVSSSASMPKKVATTIESPVTFSDRLRFLGNVVKNQLSGGGATLGDSSAFGLLKKPESLRCSMTYVNVPWQSISIDLLDFAKQRDHQEEIGPTATTLGAL